MRSAPVGSGAATPPTPTLPDRMSAPRPWLPVAALVTAAFIFGTSFVVVKEGLDAVDPIPFLAWRYLLAAVSFWGLARGSRPTRTEWRVGGLAGLSYAAGMVLQTLGLERTTPSAAAFLTYLLVVIVPIISVITTRRPPSARATVAIAVSLAGLVLLTGGGFGLGAGELMVLGSAVAFAVHLVQVTHASRITDVFRFNAVQSLVIAGLLLPLVPFNGGVDGATGWAVVVYAAVAVTVGAQLPWTWASRHLSSTRTALILLLEPVFAALASAVRGERLTPVALAGAALILAGAAVAALDGADTGPRRRSRGSSRRRSPTPVSGAGSPGVGSP